MNPYLQIARDHLTVEDLKMLLAEKSKEPNNLSKEDQRREERIKKFWPI